MAIRDDEIRIWHDIPISSPERVFCELAAVLDLADLVSVGDFLLRRMLPLTSPEALTAAIARYPGRRGVRVLHAARPMLTDRSESRKESHLRVIILLAGLPGPKVLIEYHSDYRSDPDNFRADMTRRARLEADGWIVMLINANDLRDPDELIARIRTVLASRVSQG